MSAQATAKAVEIIPDLKPKILLMDDDKEFLEDQLGQFEDMGGVLHTAYNFKIGSKLIGEHEKKPFYDHIFVDYEFKKEKFNGDQFIIDNYERIKDTPLAIIATAPNAKLLEFGKKYKIKILKKEAGLDEKLAQILDQIKKIKDGRFNEFVDNIKKMYEGKVTINEKQEEGNLQKQIKNLFLDNVSKMSNQQKESFILGGKKWSPETLYAEVEKNNSEIGNMVLELFINYIEFSINSEKDGNDE